MMMPQTKASPSNSEPPQKIRFWEEGSQSVYLDGEFVFYSERHRDLMQDVPRPGVRASGALPLAAVIPTH